MIDRPTGRIAPWMAERMKLRPDSVLGTADVASLLGVTRQRVSQLKKDPTFPRAGMHYGRVGMWHRAGIELWLAAHRPDRPEAAGRFAGEAAELLIAAEGHARRLGVHWIESSLFWLAVVTGAAGHPLRDALRSMGVTEDDIESVVKSMRSSDDRPTRALRMNPHVQTMLAGADRAVAGSGRDRIGCIDILLAFIDAKPIRFPGERTQPADHLLAVLASRRLDIAELRRRLVDAAKDASAVASFEQRALGRPRGRRRKRPDFALAPNPLGHDPWTRRPWGAAFARTREGRHLEVDGENWFFTIDGDGFYVRAKDGRPVGYRYRKLTKTPKRTPRPVNGFTEVLPMPPADVADWPDKRFGPPD